MNKVYIENVVAVLRELEDREYQVNVWLNMDNPNNLVGSFVEAVNVLFDDCIIGGLLEDGEIIVSRHVTSVLQELSAIIDSIDEYRPEEEIIDDPKMQAVRDKAALALDLIRTSDGSESTVCFVRAGTAETSISIEEAFA